jgi:transcriptional regulator with XRE-family HTH domain
MTNQSLTPKRWRQQKQLSMAGIAAMLGIGGKNPARTWHRYETGISAPPISLVARVELISDGQVTTSSWMNVRQSFLSRKSSEVSP